MTHCLVSLITHPSTTFHHIPESGPCAYPRSINTTPLCNNNSKLGLLSGTTQSHILPSLAPRPLVIITYTRPSLKFSSPIWDYSLACPCLPHGGAYASSAHITRHLPTHSCLIIGNTITIIIVVHSQSHSLRAPPSFCPHRFIHVSLL